MGNPEQTPQNVPGSAAAEWDEIETIIGRAREGVLAEEAAFEAIGRIVHRRTAAAETYQKPWG